MLNFVLFYFLSHFHFSFNLFYILGTRLEFSMMSHITVTNCHMNMTQYYTSVTVTLSHTIIENNRRF